MVVEHLPSMHKVLGSTPSTTPLKKKKKSYNSARVIINNKF